MAGSRRSGRALMLLAAALTSLVSVTSAAQCYNVGYGLVGKNNWATCNNTTPASDGAQICCMPGDTCSQDGLCRSDSSDSGDYIYYNAGCTDSNYASSVCRKSCVSFSAIYVEWLPAGDEWACCGNVGTCDPNNPTNITFQASGPSKAFNQPNIVSSSSSSSASTASTSSSSTLATSASTSIVAATTAASFTSSATSTAATSSKSAAGSSGLSTGAAAGAGAGAAVVGLLIVGAAAWYFLRRRKQQRGFVEEEKDGMYSDAGPVVPAKYSAEPKVAPPQYQVTELDAGHYGMEMDAPRHNAELP